MSTLQTAQRWLAVTVAALILSWAPGSQAAVPESWKDAGYSVDASGMTLRSVLEQFGQVYGVRISFDIPNVTVRSGRLRADSGSDFLDRMAQPYRFRWFVYANTLYVVPRDDNTSVRLEVGEDAVQDAKGALVGMGLFDTRFGWGELPDEGVVIISGPREYVRLAKEILLPDAAKAEQKKKRIMVFRLKYASATDRVIAARSGTETIPGVKTILENLLLGGRTTSKYEDPSKRFDASSNKRSRGPKSEAGEAKEVGRGPFSLVGNRQESNQQQESNSDSRSSGSSISASDETRPSIEADPSLNAIMIYDQASKREMYQDLIDALDVEPQQIEIEALIVDIDRSKLSELGVEWGVRSPNGNVVSRINATTGDSEGVDLPLPGSTLLISNAARFYARLKAMEGTGEAHVLATPTVLTLNNVAAVLDLSQTVYTSLLAERYADIADITAGTMLRVIPRIVQDGATTRVRLEVDIEDGKLGDSNASQTNVTRSTISTQAIIDLHQTLMIGGYRSESVSSNEQKVPVLGDVPLFGNLFRSESTSRGSRERLFLITPRLLSPPAMTAAPESKAGAAARKEVAKFAQPEQLAPQETLSPAAAVREPAPVVSTPPMQTVSTADPVVTQASAAPVQTALPLAPAAPRDGGGVELKMSSSFAVEKHSVLSGTKKRAKYKCGPSKRSTALPGTRLF